MTDLRDNTQDRLAEDQYTRARLSSYCRRYLRMWRRGRMSINHSITGTRQIRMIPVPSTPVARL